MIDAIHKYGRYDGRQWTFSGEGAEAETAVPPKVLQTPAARGPGRAAAPKAAEPVAATAAAPTAAPTAGAAAPEKAPAAPGYRAAVKPDVLLDIFDAVFKGEHDRIKGLVEGALAGGHKPLAIVNESMTMAIKEVGDRFSTGELFLPDLLLSASTMQEAMGVLAPLLEGDSRFVSKGKVVLGTIKGDLHDIGKNMVKALLKGNGFEVVDIGIDNGPDKFVDSVKKHGPDVVGYSGLLTTTLSGIPDQMEALRKAGLRDKVLTIVGGAPVTPEFAERNGVDLYGKDANEAVKVIEKALAARKRGGTG
jgi:5-methyltetrahydrofolate--homocysteine methyltransferase